ncbi:dynamin-binding protein [Hydra vulgaris]|uniref:dynamin-binding protein n=1 Tax=Hydra vulgaris TaxID=6087 RepID=UPI001F5E4F3A|nr:dynamin-binding protein [Hydra vulgaris]
MMAGGVVRCVFNFDGDKNGDLSLVAGDYVKITNVLNDNWYEGVSDNGCKGRFPKVFTEDCEGIINLAIALSKFDAEQESDLSLEKGDIVLISDVIDENWMQGFKKGCLNKGIFPKDFVKHVDNEIVLKELKKTSVSLLTKDSVSDIIADVINNFSAQFNDELTLKVGTKIKFIKFIDNFWSFGESLEDKKQGIFPTEFVKLPSNIDFNLNKNLKNKEIIDLDVNNAVSSEPCNDSSPFNDNKSSYLKKAFALFSFSSAEPGDLNFEKDSEILIIEKINEHWFKGRFNDKEGIFPSSFVKIADEKITLQTELSFSNTPENQVYCHDAVSTSEDVNPCKTTDSAVSNYNKKNTNQNLITSKKLNEENLMSGCALKITNPLLIIPFSYRKNENSNIVVLKKLF